MLQPEKNASLFVNEDDLFSSFEIEVERARFADFKNTVNVLYLDIKAYWHVY